MPRLRIFLALRLSGATRSRLGETKRRMVDAIVPGIEGVPGTGGALRFEGSPVRPVAEANLHLTLKFLGEVSADLVPPIQEAAATVARMRGRPAFLVRGLGTFPPRGMPRVVWAGVCERGATHPRLALNDGDVSGLAGTVRDLEQSLRECLAAAACEETESTAERHGLDRRPFSAHITLGRVRSKPRVDRRTGRTERRESRDALGTGDGPAWLGELRAFLKAHEGVEFGEEIVDGISIMRSRLRPGGPEYEELDRLEFQG